VREGNGGGEDLQWRKAVAATVNGSNEEPNGGIEKTKEETMQGNETILYENLHEQRT